jgi:hypothetical protein
MSMTKRELRKLVELRCPGCTVTEMRHSGSDHLCLTIEAPSGETVKYTTSLTYKDKGTRRANVMSDIRRLMREAQAVGRNKKEVPNA